MAIKIQHGAYEITAETEADLLVVLRSLNQLASEADRSGGNSGRARRSLSSPVVAASRAAELPATGTHNGRNLLGALRDVIATDAGIVYLEIAERGGAATDVQLRERLRLRDNRALAGLFTSTSRVLGRHGFTREDVLEYERIRGDAAGEHRYRLTAAAMAVINQINTEAAAEMQ